ncbi:macro domain-containing protein [Acholeplasma vituli]|uniref:Macro domain-containing protein n=2 Tax=Paracholeplasma vituli TaxID=69473 RepID=A0ABT2PW10_9MOLU|nr:macro domain-containing protein [Paracholeplasma vituli]
MFIFTHGDLLKSNAPALVNTVNLEGFMGKGIAFQFKKEFPQNYINYVAACESMNINIGKLFVFEEKGKIIINFPTKNKWREKSKLEYIEQGLIDLKRVVKQYGINKIAIPPLGSGNGGLEWSKVKSLIIEILSGINNCEIYVFEPGVEIVTGVAPKTSLNELLILNIIGITKDKIVNSKALYYVLYFIDIITGDNNFQFDSVRNLMSNKKVTNTLKNIEKLEKYYNSNNYNDIFNKETNRLLSNSVSYALLKQQRLLPFVSNLINKYSSELEWRIIVDILYLVSKGQEPNLDSDNHKEIFYTLINNGLIIQDLIGFQLNESFHSGDK